nr:MAG TPA: PROTEIN/RNA Complex, archaeal, ribosomal, 50S, protein.0A [Caudoviricetes sp.]
MAEYIEREALKRAFQDIDAGRSDGWTTSLSPEEATDYLAEYLDDIPAADVAPVKHGHIMWKEYHKGGIRRRKCLQEIKSVYIEQQMPCKHITIVDERYLSKDPYCSECGMLLGEFLSYCGNCGAKMDGGDGNV